MKEGSLARVASGLAVVCTMWIPLVSAAPTPSRVVAAGAKLEAVFEGGVFLEGPAAAPDGSIYVSDVTRTSKTGMQAGHIWRYDPRSRTTAIFRSPSGMANGLAFDAEGRLLAAEGADFGGRRVTRTDLKTGKSYIVAGLFDGRPFNASGQMVEIIPTPENAVNVEFGRGPELHTLYIAAQQKLYRIQLQTSRFRLPWE